MLMFRFWTSDSRGSDETLQAPQPIAGLVKPLNPQFMPATAETIAQPNMHYPKRRRQSIDDMSESSDACMPAKRFKTETNGHNEALTTCDPMSQDAPTTTDVDRARDEIRHQFGLEILLKHDELRLINQELAKCQIALEQLRRCHLIPYPVNCPTPDQMLDVSAGKGPALQSRPGETVPRWAPPFGVVDGPYARHYAKWLIPDPSFDGVQPEWQFTAEATRSRSSFTEGRTTRNSITETGVAPKGRSGRSIAGQKLQSLSSGYPQPKEKAGPCVLKRSDGQTVKLVCIDCNRENFSSTQGFINHCRIAHKRDFKSHEEAAVHSGHPIEAVERSGNVVEEKAAPAPVTTTASVHPFSRSDITEQQAYVALRSRIDESLKLYHQGKLPGVTGIPSIPAVTHTSKTRPSLAEPSSETPHLSRLLQSQKFEGNLRDLVLDAKAEVPWDDISPGEESETIETPQNSVTSDAANARTPVVMRVPAGVAQSPALADSAKRPASSKGRAAPIPFTTPISCGLKSKPDSKSALSEEDVDMEDADMSPNTLISNNAPSLVSDDGEYDDSDDGSSVSGVSDNLEAESVSDVAEITLDDEQDPRSLRRGSSGVSGTVRLRKDDPKHVTLMGSVRNTARDRRSRNTQN